MARREMLLRQMEHLENELARLDDLVDLSELDDGAVISFQKKFTGTPRRTYNYVAVKHNGQWWMTGTTPATNVARNDEAMAEWIATGWPTGPNAPVQEMWYATEWESLS